MKTRKVLSFGGGVQTGALLAMVINGDFEKPDVVIFADPGWETKETYRFIDYCKDRCKKIGLPFLTGSRGNIREDSLSGGFVKMPLFTSKGLGQRQCTSDYKIAVVFKTARDFFGIKKGIQIKPPIENWLGISMDEVIRMKHSMTKSFENRWPLIEKKMNRTQCLEYLEKHSWPRPAKSACIGCPFHDNGFWRNLKKNSPEEWDDAVDFDTRIRIGSKGVQQFIHSSLVPLSAANLGEDQLDFFMNECEGHCGL